MSQAAAVKSALTMESSKQTSQTQPTDEQIRQRAYEIYLSRNEAQAPGDEVQDWLQAEGELRSPKSLSDGMVRTGWAREDTKGIAAFIERFGQRVTDCACVPFFRPAAV